jgi:hypothetical protein
VTEAVLLVSYRVSSLLTSPFLFSLPVGILDSHELQYEGCRQRPQPEILHKGKPYCNQPLGALTCMMEERVQNCAQRGLTNEY